MKKLILCFTLFALLPVGARADFILGTSNPAGSPLNMNAGTTSGAMAVTVFSDAGDVMSAWQFVLAIVPSGGATGTLTFQDPGGPTAPNPSPYVFGANGLGITAINSGNQLLAFDFDLGDLPGGATVPPSSGTNLLQIDFLASLDAAGTFGIYAVDGVNNTSWSPPLASPLLFTNVPDDSGMTLIGEVGLTPAVSTTPEPSSLTLIALGSVILAGWCRLRRRPLTGLPAAG